MKLRLAQPAHVVDLRKVDGLTGVREVQGTIQIGALTTHATVAKSELLRAKLPMAAEAAGQIATPRCAIWEPSVELAHADRPRTACRPHRAGRLVVVAAAGRRTLKVEQLIQGPLTTALELERSSPRCASLCLQRARRGPTRSCPTCLAFRGGRRCGGDLARRANTVSGRGSRSPDSGRR